MKKLKDLRNKEIRVKVDEKLWKTINELRGNHKMNTWLAWLIDKAIKDLLEENAI